MNTPTPIPTPLSPPPTTRPTSSTDSTYPSHPNNPDPSYPPDDPNTIENELLPCDFLSYHNIEIPDSNQVSSQIFKKSLSKKPLIEAVAMLDCPIPRFWALQSAVKVGYLQKQGHHFRNWKKRLAAIEGHYLYYYSSESDSLPKGVLLLDNCVVEEDPAVGKERKSCCFAVTAIKSWNIQSIGAYVNRTYLFCVNSAQEMNDWMALINTLSTNMPRYATEELW